MLTQDVTIKDGRIEIKDDSLTFANTQSEAYNLF